MFAMPGQVFAISDPGEQLILDTEYGYVRQERGGTPGLDKLVIDCESGARARVMRAGPGEILHPALFTDP